MPLAASERDGEGEKENVCISFVFLLLNLFHTRFSDLSHLLTSTVILLPSL